MPEPAGYEKARLAAMRQRGSYCSKYPNTTVPDFSSDKVLWQEVLLAIDDVKRTSSPGVPMVKVEQLNSKLIDGHGVFLANAAFQRLVLLRGDKLVEPMTPEQLVQGGFCDPVRVFVKQEPHSLEKAREGRFRLISSVSVIDQIVERVLCRRQNNAEILDWKNLASCPGIGLTDDSDNVNIWNKVQVAAEDFDVAYSDLSGFDWSVQEFELVGDAKCRVELAHAQNTAYERMLMNRVFCLCRTVFCLSDGTLMAQVHPGVQLSGSYNTSSTNSRIRVVAAFFVGADWCIAMGDDAVEKAIEGAKDKYIMLGKRVKEYTVTSAGQSFDFCSHTFCGGSVAKPINWSRSLFRLLHQKEDRMNHLVEFVAGHRHNDNLNQVLGVIVRVGWCTESDVVESINRVATGNWSPVKEEEEAAGDDLRSAHAASC
jgi:hypothetical protein